MERNLTAIEILVFALGLLALSTLVLFVASHAKRNVTLAAPMLFAIRITAGVILSLLGVIGCLLPVLQGWLFFLLAALVFFPRSRFAIRTVEKISVRAPRLAQWLRRFGIGNGVAVERDTIHSR